MSHKQAFWGQAIVQEKERRGRDPCGVPDIMPQGSVGGRKHWHSKTQREKVGSLG